MVRVAALGVPLVGPGVCGPADGPADGLADGPADGLAAGGAVAMASAEPPPRGLAPWLLKPSSATRPRTVATAVSRRRRMTGS